MAESSSTPPVDLSKSNTIPNNINLQNGLGMGIGYVDLMMNSMLMEQMKVVSSPQGGLTFSTIFALIMILSINEIKPMANEFMKYLGKEIPKLIKSWINNIFVKTWIHIKLWFHQTFIDKPLNKTIRKDLYSEESEKRSKIIDEYQLNVLKITKKFKNNKRRVDKIYQKRKEIDELKIKSRENIDIMEQNGSNKIVICEKEQSCQCCSTIKWTPKIQPALMLLNYIFKHPNCKFIKDKSCAILPDVRQIKYKEISFMYENMEFKFPDITITFTKNHITNYSLDCVIPQLSTKVP